MIQKIFSIFIVLVFFSGFGYGAIPASERAALIALYNSTNGGSWANNSGWKTAPLHTDGFAMPGTEGNWRGIYLDGGHVTNISLYNNKLTGSLPAELGNLFYIGYMNIGDNESLTGPIPPEMGNLVNLTYLNLHDMDLTGTIPPQLGNLTKLQYFDTGDNDKLYGLIPPELGNLVNLTYLNIHDNDLEGPLPPEFGNLTKLQSLSLRDNDVSGSIPAQLGNLVNLESLNLDNNEFSGPIPTELGNLTKLEVLSIISNELTGSIPPELGNLTRLTTLDLDFNRLTGEIPAGIMNLTRLTYLDLAGNCLYCTNPTVRAWLNDKNYSWGYTQTKCGATTSSIIVTSPNGGENWAGGSVNNITWTSAGAVHNVKIEYSTDNGASWNEIASDYHNDWFYPWIVPNIAAANCLIRISDHYAGGTPSDTSNASFTISYSNLVPFGEFSTPIDGSTVSGSVPVTGWALDNIEVSKVEIFNGDTDIGDALFVEGARPDIEAAYPTYPKNNRAGWGYMLLTNFLPNAGNGTYTLYARATDAEGNQVILGAKTITCDNAHAVKPFGAIDTPAQGGTASGKKFVNWGWVLTPLPNYIPSNGSTIDVWVDGKNKGHPTYDIKRPDILSLFPGYNNSNGAGGYFYLDTTAYANGIHTISWSATDNAGNSDGIGSRFFSVQNTGIDIEKKGSAEARKSGRAEKYEPGRGSAAFSPCSPVNDRFGAVDIIKGYREDAAAIPQAVYPDENGIIAVEIKELERLEIHFPASPVNNLSPLPIGSTLDTGKGIFYWQPGPGFIGEYNLVFIEEENTGMVNRKDIKVNITPEF